MQDDDFDGLYLVRDKQKSGTFLSVKKEQHSKNVITMYIHGNRENNTCTCFIIS